VELRDADNIPVVRLGISDKMCPSKEEKERRVLPCVGSNLIGRLMVQCSVEPGLAEVFDHLLAFEHNEFYFSSWDQLIGRNFADACFSFEGAVCIGICTPQLVEGKRIFLNPPGDVKINVGDSLIFIAEDNDTYHCMDNMNLSAPGKPPDVKEEAKKPTRTLLIGWRRDMQEMVFEVDKWAPPGSKLTILAPGCEDDGYAPPGPTIAERLDELAAADCDPAALQNIVLENVEGNPLVRPGLMKAKIHEFDSVLILTAEEDGKEGIKSDSRSMVTMLLCRDIQNKEAAPDDRRTNPFLVAEILDPRTATLCSLAAADDFMVSNRLVSEALAQMSQEINIHPLVEDLFSPEGSEMHIKDIKLYAAQGESLSFWELLARARMRCEIAIGYYKHGGKELVMNPLDKSAPICWDPADRVVVLSED